MSFEIDNDIEFPNVDSEKGLSDILEYMLHESNKIVPHEEGTLERSGIVDVEENKGTISYDTPYAIKQHEDRTLNHDEGREAKYLERTLKRKHDRALKYLADELGDMF